VLMVGDGGRRDSIPADDQTDRLVCSHRGNGHETTSASAAHSSTTRRFCSAITSVR
jgi:hypothetical protein